MCKRFGKKVNFLCVHNLKNDISSADISARACYYRKSIKLNCAVYYTCSSPFMGRVGGVLQFLSHDIVGLTIAEDVELVVTEEFVISMNISNTCVIN